MIAVARNTGRSAVANFDSTLAEVRQAYAEQLRRQKAAAKAKGKARGGGRRAGPGAKASVRKARVDPMAELEASEIYKGHAKEFKEGTTKEDSFQ